MSVARLTLTAGPGFRLSGLDGLVPGGRVTEPPPRASTLTHFDTAGFRLEGWQCGLTRGPDRNWVVAVPRVRADGSIRELIEAEFAGTLSTPPPEAAEVLSAYLRGAMLQPVARTRAKERARTVTSRRGLALATVMDRRLQVGRREARAAVRDLDVRVERTQGATVGDLIARRLRRAGAWDRPPLPLLVRALPGTGAGAEITIAELGVEPTAGEVVTAAVSRSVVRLVRNDPLVRLGIGGGLRQMRVALRRLESDLRTFRDLLDPAWAGELRAGMRGFSASLGAGRDAEVRLDRIRGLRDGLSAGPGRPGHRPRRQPAARLVARARAQSRHANAILIHDLGHPAYFGLLDRLITGANRPPLLAVAARPAAKVLPGLVKRPWQRLRDAVRALGREPADAELHRVRLLAKRCRYAVAAVGVVAGSDALRFADALADVQAVLGEHHDATATIAWLEAEATRDPGVREAAERMILSERGCAVAARVDLRTAWAAAAKKNLRDWM